MSTEAFDEIQTLIDIYLRKISKDHHKTKDGYFLIECSWDGWSKDVTPRFQAVHNGYIDELDSPERDTFEEAVQDLRDFLVESIAEYEMEEWGLV